MSAKDMLYGIVSMVVPNCTGLDGGTYTGYLVDVNLFTDPLLGNSIKGTTFSVGDVVTIIQCGESLAFGGTDVPMHGWAFCEYSYSYPSVYQVPNAALARSICTDPRYSASVSMNWICRHSGAVDSLYWPGRITAISGSTVTVCDQFGAGAYQMPVSSDLSIGDFSVGDYVLVYSPSSGEQVIGWWLMAPNNKYAALTASISLAADDLCYGEQYTFTISVSNSGTKNATGVSVDIGITDGSISGIVPSVWAVGTLNIDETKTYTMEGIALLDGTITAEMSSSDPDDEIHDDSLEFSVRQAVVNFFMRGGNELVLHTITPNQDHEAFTFAIYNLVDETIVFRFTLDDNDPITIATIDGFYYDTLYSSNITGSGYSYIATASIGKAGVGTINLTYSIDLSDSITVSVSES